MIQTDLDSGWIEICVNHNEPYLTVKNKFARAKKNTLDFFSQVNGSIIKDVQIAADDRIIKIIANDFEIYFAIRGKFTNVFLLNNNIIQSFKQEDDEILNTIKSEFSNKKFINNFNSIGFELIKDKEITEIRKEFKFIGKEIENEVNLRKSLNDIIDSDSRILLDVIEDIKIGNPVLCIDEKISEIKVAFSSLRLFNDFKKVNFDSLIASFNQYLINKYQMFNKQSRLKLINLHLEKELKRLSKKLNELLVVINSGSKEELYNKYANLILINLSANQNKPDEIEVEDIYESENLGIKVKIKLDEKLSLQKNADAYFEKSKDSRLRFEKSKMLYIEAKARFDRLLKISEEVKNQITEERIISIMRELKIKESNTRNIEQDESSKFKHYLIEKKYHVYVGKDSHNNDLLTTKFARQNDFWFHARSVSGSHVVLRVENSKETIPKNVLKKTAALAAYHSKAKTAGTVPVSYCLKKYVIKRKGAPAGQVSLLKEEVLLVKPEIPFDAEYLTE